MCMGEKKRKKCMKDKNSKITLELSQESWSMKAIEVMNEDVQVRIRQLLALVILRAGIRW